MLIDGLCIILKRDGGRCGKAGCNKNMLCAEL